MLTTMNDVARSPMIADDSVFLTFMITFLLKQTPILSLLLTIREKGAKYLQAFSCANGISIDDIKVDEKRKSCLTTHNIFLRKRLNCLSMSHSTMQVTIHSRLGQPVTWFVVKCPHAWLDNLCGVRLIHTLWHLYVSFFHDAM